MEIINLFTGEFISIDEISQSNKEKLIYGYFTRKPNHLDLEVAEKLINELNKYIMYKGGC